MRPMCRIFIGGSLYFWHVEPPVPVSLAIA